MQGNADNDKSDERDSHRRSIVSPALRRTSWMANMTVKQGKITEEMIRVLSAWKHSWFHVFCGNRISPSDDKAMENLVRYIIWALFSQERMQIWIRRGRSFIRPRIKKRQARFSPPPYKVRGRLWNDWPPCELFKVCVHITRKRKLLSNSKDTVPLLKAAYFHAFSSGGARPAFLQASSAP